MSLIIHPEFKKLENKLANLILEYQELKLRICPNLEREYLIKFGFLEYELYKKDVDLSILKRKLRLIQVQINNEDEINVDLIEEKIKMEFGEYLQNIEKQMDELNKVMGEKYINVLSEDELNKIKTIYRKSVLKLHPDLNDDLTEFQKDLFIQITEAFKNGDLDSLESLYYLVPDNELEPVSQFDRLKELIDIKEKEIYEIKENYPYNKKDLIFNELKCEEYILELKNLIKQFDEEIEKYNNRILSLI